MYACASIGAGCTFATTWVSIYLYGSVLAWRAANPLTWLDVHIDDFVLTPEA